MFNFRKASDSDIDIIEQFYEDIHSCEEKGEVTIGWARGVYPTRATAEAALLRGDLFVMEVDGIPKGSAIINQIQVPEYRNGNWTYHPSCEEVMVLHALVISPTSAGKGYGRKFVEFYERYALENGCRYLRMDTNEKNTRARRLYQTLGYREVGIFPCDFNGIPSIRLVLLEKCLKNS